MLKRWLVAFFDWMARRCAHCGTVWADLADDWDEIPMDKAKGGQK